VEFRSLAGLPHPNLAMFDSRLFFPIHVTKRPLCVIPSQGWEDANTPRRTPKKIVVRPHT
jgi:hypothetical protein